MCEIFVVLLPQHFFCSLTPEFALFAQGIQCIHTSSMRQDAKIIYFDCSVQNADVDLEVVFVYKQLLEIILP